MNAILQTAIEALQQDREDYYNDFVELEAQVDVYREVEMPHNNILVIDGQLKADIVGFRDATYWNPKEFSYKNERFIGTLTVYELETDKEIYNDTLTLNITQ